MIYLEGKEHIAEYTKTQVEFNKGVEGVLDCLKGEAKSIDKKVQKSQDQHDDIVMPVSGEEIVRVVFVCDFEPACEDFFDNI